MPALIALFAAVTIFACGMVLGRRFGMTEGREQWRRARDDSDEAGA